MRSAVAADQETTHHRLEWNPTGCASPRDPPHVQPSIREVFATMVDIPGDFDATGRPLGEIHAHMVYWGDQSLWPSGAYRAWSIKDGVESTHAGRLFVIPGPENPICVPEPSWLWLLLCGLGALALLSGFRNAVGAAHRA